MSNFNYEEHEGNSPEFNYDDYENVEPKDSWLKAHGKAGLHSFLSTPTTGIYNALKHLGVPLKPLELPEFARVTEQDMNYPISRFLGGALSIPGGARVLGGAAGKAMSAGAGVFRGLNSLRNANEPPPELASAKTELQDFEEHLHKIYGMEKPEQFGRGMYKAQEKINGLSEVANQPDLPVKNLLPKPAGEINLSEKQKNLANALREVQEYLNPRQQHDVKVQEYFKDRPQELRNFASQKFYNPARKLISDIKVEVPSSPDTKLMHKNLEASLGKGYELNPANQKIIEAYTKQFSNEKTKSIPLSELFDTYNAVKDELFRARGLSRQQSIPVETRQAAEAKVRDLEPIFEKQKSLIEEFSPKEALDLLKGGNDFYSQNIGPLYDAPLYWQSQKDTGLQSANLMHALRGRAKGQQLLRNMSRENPFVARALVGQRYANNPEQLAGELPHHEEEFVNALPALQGMRQRLASALQEHSQAQMEADFLKNEAKAITKEWMKIKDAQARKEAAQAEIGELEKELNSYERELQELLHRHAKAEELEKVMGKIEKRKMLLKYVGFDMLGHVGLSSIKGLIKMLVNL